MKLVNVPGVEIFRAGNWHGERHSNVDIERMAHDNNAFLPYFRAKLALRHSVDQPAILNEASFGRVTRFYTAIRDGVKSLYADFERVPAVVAKAIKYFYPECSIEVPYVTRHPKTGELKTNIISAVAFLGKTPPEVKGMLNEFAAVFSQQATRRMLSGAPDGVRVFSQETAVYRIMTKFADYLKARREELQKAPDAFAEELGITVEALAELEDGRRDPTADELSALAKALDVEEDALKALLQEGDVEDDDSAIEDDADAGADAGKSTFEQGVKAAAKMFQQELNKRDKQIEGLVKRGRKQDMQSALNELKGQGLPAVLSGPDMLEFLLTLDNGKKCYSADGNSVGQAEYMLKTLRQIAKVGSVPAGESELGDEQRQTREFEQMSRDADGLIQAVRKEKDCTFAEALIEANKRRPDLFQ